MSDIDKTGIKLRARYLAHHMIISFLLAREAVAHGGSPMLKDLHAYLVQQVSDSCPIAGIATLDCMSDSEIAGMDIAEISVNFEAAAVHEIDKLFILASSFYRRVACTSPPAE